MHLRCFAGPATASPSTPTAPPFRALLHGTLHVTVVEASDVSFRAIGSAPKFFRKLVEDIEDLTGLGMGSTGVYVSVELEDLWIGRTRLLDEPVNPSWNESFHACCANTSANVTFSLRFDNSAGSTLIGKAHLPVDEILSGEEADQWLEVRDEVHTSWFGLWMKIHVKVRLDNASRDAHWGRGICNPDCAGVPYTYFPQRNGCKVTLYQDADVSNDLIQRIPLDSGNFYKPNRCWDDIFLAISKARHLIYIAGWSLNKDISLVKDKKHQTGDCHTTIGDFLKLAHNTGNGNDTLGELLQRKANEGVRVLVLISDDVNDTLQYFKDTKVHCILCTFLSRNKNSLKFEAAFAHNQKVIVVDSMLPGEGSRRGISSFIGGLDLREGIYDTQDHSLLKTIHGASTEKGEPRLPWHDVHCKLEGPIAWDVLFNFEQIWREQGGEDVLVDTIDTLDATPYSAMLPEDQENWKVQLFRSIQWEATSSFLSHLDEIDNVGLIRLKDTVIERSIQDAYLYAIRRAKNFIYIETEYFTGISHGPEISNKKTEDVEALNLVQRELSLKIVSKIEAGEQFAVYVVIPMWPGCAHEVGVLQMLGSQARVIETMYIDIASALRSKGLDVNPKDYLSFFCLANREAAVRNEHAPPETPDASSSYLHAQQYRRFMVYVHSNMMIVDDEYIIIGSAYTAQTSMGGAGDSEIAMGAYQPNHLTNQQEGRAARGEIHGYRMALWQEHLGQVNDAFYWPQSPDCMRTVNEIAQKHWDMYASDSFEHDLPGHLLSYPISVTPDGDVVNLPDVEFFPDTMIPILGTRQQPASDLPTIATTCLLKWSPRVDS